MDREDLQGAESLLAALSHGDRESLDRLMPLVYQELHRMASSVLRGESTTRRTRPTSLVNELYLELQRQGSLRAESQKHFFHIAGYLMRRILVQHARRRAALKRGSGRTDIPISDFLASTVPWEDHPERMLALNEALSRLSDFDPIKASIVDLRFFADLSVEDTARVLEMSPTTVKRHWAVARVWLFDQLQSDGGSEASAV
ncbi:DNA-directed RNA polymerase sigma-70 factor [Bryobacterales bacterium F-183]|nr:DNA-directed RNA polymerase sigma-70 factor [Bryobacterales bacterium F-183]